MQALIKILHFCREADMTKERIEKILKAGANVVLTTKGIDDMALKAIFYMICFFIVFYPRNTVPDAKQEHADISLKSMFFGYFLLHESSCANLNLCGCLFLLSCQIIS